MMKRYPGCFLLSLAGAAYLGGAEPVAIPDLETARRGNEETMDSSASLEMLVRTLGGTADPDVQAALIRGMLLGLEGRRNVTPPDDWPRLRSRLTESPSRTVRELTGRLGQVFGDEEATRRALSLLRDREADLDERRLALASLLTQRSPALLPVLEELLENEPLRTAAIRGFGVIESDRVPTLLLERYSGFGPEDRRAVIETLATRKSYAEALFEALREERVARDAVPAYVARSLESLLGERFTELFGVSRLSRDKEARIAKYLKMASPEALAGADASAGRMIYQRVCFACHQMYGEGGIVGPDLTGSNRADLNYLLLNIVDPSGDIPDAYRMTVVTTNDGRVLTGTVTAEDGQRIELSMVGQKTTVVKSDIRSRQTSEVSMMPEGLLESLKLDEVLDLFSYMQTKRQVDLPGK